MRRTLQRFVRPIVDRILAAARLPHPVHLTETEQSPEYYDHKLVSNPRLRGHYSESQFFPLWSIIAERIVLAEPDSVLDIGCGSGQFACLLRDREIKRYLGIDFSPKRLEHARRVCPEFGFALTNVFETELLRTHDYDTVVCTEFLEHVWQDKQVIAEIRPGTEFFGSVPDCGGPAHVRRFVNISDVKSRYSPFFQDLSVHTHACTFSGKTYFLMNGVRSEFRWEIGRKR